MNTNTHTVDERCAAYAAHGMRACIAVDRFGWRRKGCAEGDLPAMWANRIIAERTREKAARDGAL